MNMGSKTEIKSDLFATRMLDEEHGLYGKELARIFAQTLDMSPKAMLPAVLNDSNMFFNEAVFETMGASTKIEMSVGKLTDESVLAHIKQNIDPEASEIVAVSYGVSPSIMKVYDFLNSTLPSNNSCTQHFYENLTLTQPGHYYVDYPTWEYEGKNCGVVSGEGTNGVSPYLWIYQNGDYKKTKFKLFEHDGACGHNGTEHEIELPEDNRTVIAIEYKAGSATRYTYAFTEGMIREEHSDYTGLMLLMKKDFEVPESDKYRKFLYNRFGLGTEGPPPEEGEEEQPSLEDSIADAENLKDAFITYSCSKNDEEFGALVSEIYAMGNEVKCTGEINFEYEARQDAQGLTKYFIIFEHGMFSPEKVDENGEDMYLYMMPIEELRTLSLPRKFKAYNKMFCMWGYSEVEVEIKWYQTGFFRFIMMIVGAILAFLTFGVAGLIMYGLMQIGMKLLALIDPRLAAIVGLVVGLLMMDVSQVLNSVLMVTNNVLAIVQTFNQVAFEKDLQAIKDRTDDYIEKTEEANEELSEIDSNQILMSFGDKVDYLYNGNMEAAYSAPQMIAASVDMSQIASVDKYYT